MILAHFQFQVLESVLKNVAAPARLFLSTSQKTTCNAAKEPNHFQMDSARHEQSTELL
ncbi:unnamed protein product [Oikopleura dioica]|uniref:Uncharacterized protein n=1 Tax=Oikopleura dioica TaxID=34765 RepID=E4YGR2_OIKDI|nr:unnamed protein product [Oikopleura dioica]